MTKTSYDISDWLNYLTHDEIDLLKKVCGLLPNRPMIVNIGAGAGTSALAFREARSDARLWTIDNSKGGPLGGLDSENQAFRDAGRVLPDQILGDSKEVGERFWDKPIDFLFIDGDHSEQGVGGDIDAWFPHVKEGGYIAFHDYGSNDWPAVKEVVDECMNGYKVVGQVGAVKVFQV
jgi:predicted O-methyltransferase YrrM